MQINPIARNPYTSITNKNRNASTDSFVSTMGKVSDNHSSYKVYMKKDDMLYSGGNGTGLSFYLKYAEDSTEDNPKVLARGVDENGNEFEQTINVNDVNPRNATIIEMHALEATSGATKRNGLTSLPMGSENVGINQRQDFMAAFKKNIADMNLLGEKKTATEYSKLHDFYENVGNATTRSTSSNNGKNIGVMTIGNQGYIAKYADSSTDADPVIKVGDHEVHVNKVDPKNATEIEMFALTSYMDDKGLTDNTGMKSFNKMRAYSKQAEYNGFVGGIADSDNAWSMSRNWISILENAKDSYFKMPETYEHGVNCETLLGYLMGRSQKS